MGGWAAKTNKMRLKLGHVQKIGLCLWVGVCQRRGGGANHRGPTDRSSRGRRGMLGTG